MTYEQKNYMNNPLMDALYFIKVIGVLYITSNDRSLLLYYYSLAYINKEITEKILALKH